MSCGPTFSEFLLFVWRQITDEGLWRVTTGLLTLITAGATYATVREMRHSRSQSIAPEIIVLPPLHKHYVRWVPKENVGIVSGPINRPNEPDETETRIPVLRIKNIGAAAAQKIKIEWKLKLERIPGTTSIDFGDIDLSYVDGFAHLGQTTPTGSVSHGLPIADTSSTEIDYCIASPTSGYWDRLLFPHAIENRILINTIQTRREDADFLLHPLGSVEATISYFDMAGKALEKKYRILVLMEYLTDNVGSDLNPISREHFDARNLRGSITYRVEQVAPS